ncbi:uncharacterized protein LOC143231595 isoform X1 [Tachypleus tridentatus]|uniref:uncharacterized protein LOC143231595 isoform X1 n=1 Tax=Tachypleus tridentatus TaxID=6853 RepID=UPI003FD64E70
MMFDILETKMFEIVWKRGKSLQLNTEEPDLMFQRGKKISLTSSTCSNCGFYFEAEKI